ncbi:hypothetical protein EXS71_04615 [Candidatus Uhrbacteria bacterium]|nr:hypothetical protein [Candidatus Uhrbacteria bacterium]
MKRLHHVMPERKATYQEGLSGFEMEEADEHHLINSIYHADLVMTAGSTFAIDAAVFDKPIICIAFDGTAKNVPYWVSVKRFYDCYTHFEALLETGGVRLASSPEQLAVEMNRALDHPSLEKNERKKIIELLVAPFDGHASERLEHLLTQEVKKLL